MTYGLPVSTYNYPAAAYRPLLVVAAAPISGGDGGPLLYPRFRYWAQAQVAAVGTPVPPPSGRHECVSLLISLSGRGHSGPTRRLGPSDLSACRSPLASEAVLAEVVPWQPVTVAAAVFFWQTFPL